MRKPELYHFTCRHAAAKIDRGTVLRPHPQLTIGGVKLLWLTDRPDGSGCTLITNVLTPCDRREVRYTCTDVNVMPWLTAIHTLDLHHPNVQLLQYADDADPTCWYVTTRPVTYTARTPELSHALSQ